jgi:hypothetical protein
MYNEELKSRFINEIYSECASGTIKNVKYILNKASETEEILNKDLYEMTAEECEDVIRSYPSRSEGAIDINISILALYIRFCIKNGYINGRFNYFEILKFDLKKFLDKEYSENKFISRKELDECYPTLVNEQDVALLELLFNGLNLHEIRDLKETDFKEDRIIVEGRNDILISSKTYEILVEAKNQIYYFSGNGDIDPTAKGEKRPLGSSIYLFKATGQEKVNQVTYAGLRKRFDKIIDYIGHRHLRPTTVIESGMLDMAKTLKAEKGSDLEKEDWIKISERFNREIMHWWKIRNLTSDFM